MKVIESILILLYIAFVVGTGIYYYRRATGSQEEYFMAGRSFGLHTAAFSLFAAVASGSSMVGGVGLGWELGLPFYLSYGLGAVSLFPIALYLFSAQMRRTGATTLPDFFDMRYGKSVQLASAIFTVLFMALYLIPQIRASGILGSYVLGVEYKTAAIIAAISFIAYSSLGGMWAVTITSLVQGIMMMIASIVMFAVIIFPADGGLTGLFTRALEVNPEFGSANLPLMSYFGIFFIFVWFAVVAPNSVMRNLSTKDAGISRRSTALATLYYIILWAGGFSVLVAGTHMFAPGTLASADYVFFEVVGHYLPPVLAGAVFAAILASIMSSTDSFLLAVSAGIAHDLYATHINKDATDEQVVRVGLISMWIVGIIALILALDPPGLITVMVSWVSGGLVAAFAFPIVLGIWWPRANRQGAFASMVISTILYIALVITQPFPLVSEVVVVTPIALIIQVVVTLLTPAPSGEIVEMVKAQHEELAK